MPSGWRRRTERLAQRDRKTAPVGAVFFSCEMGGNRLVGPAVDYFSHAGKVTKSAPRPRWSACGIFGSTMPKFRIVSTCCTVSGSGILQHGPLAKSSKRVGRTITIKNVLGALRMSRNLGFRCIFAYFPGYQKVTRRRHPPAHSKRGQATPCPLFKIPHS